ncbi:hypothetical protein COOONC_14468 [Cooperia oncophora]
MSKSLGNVVDPFEAEQVYTADGLHFNAEKAVNVVNSDLVNNLGNLLSRATVGKLNYSQLYPVFQEDNVTAHTEQAAVHFLSDLTDIAKVTAELYDEMLFYKAIEELMRIIKACNGFFQISEPWKLKQGSQLDNVLYITYETIRISSILLQPIVPTLADNALTRCVFTLMLVQTLGLLNVTFSPGNRMAFRQR